MNHFLVVGYQWTEGNKPSALWSWRSLSAVHVQCEITHIQYWAVLQNICIGYFSTQSFHLRIYGMCVFVRAVIYMHHFPGALCGLWHSADSWHDRRCWTGGTKQIAFIFLECNLFREHGWALHNWNGNKSAPPPIWWLAWEQTTWSYRRKGARWLLHSYNSAFIVSSVLRNVTWHKQITISCRLKKKSATKVDLL